MGSGAFNDRKFYLEFNKPIRFANAGYIKPGGPQVYDDFVGDTLDSNLWSSVADTACTAAAIAVAANGTITLITDATDDRRVDFAGELIWKPSFGGVFFETRLTCSTAVANINAGLSDSKSEAATTCAVSATGANVLTTTASDAAVWCWDDDLTTNRWLGIGVKANTDATAVVGATSVPTTTRTLGIEINSAGIASYYFDGSFVGSQANAVTATTLLTPYIAVQNRTTAANTLTIDYVFVAQMGRS